MDKVDKLKQRFDTAIASRQFYEAHQILRTMHNRMQTQQIYADRHLQLLYSGCFAMLKANEFTSAFDLAELYVEALKKTGRKLDSANQFERIISLFSQLPAKLENSSMNTVDDQRTSFLNKTLDWALKSAEGRPELLQLCVKLQRKFSQILAGEGRTEQAERLNRAAEWLMTEIDRGTQCSSSSMTTPSLSETGKSSEASDGHKEMDVAEIDLD